LQVFVETLIFEQMRPWSDVAASMNGRTGYECCKRWYDCLDPSGFQLNGRPRACAWHQREKHLLEKVVNANGPTFDRLASDYFPHRNGKSLERCWIRIKAKNDIANGESPIGPGVRSSTANDQRSLERKQSPGRETSGRTRKRPQHAGRPGDEEFFTGRDFDEVFGYQKRSKPAKDDTIASKELSTEKALGDKDGALKSTVRPVLKKRKAATDVDEQRTQKVVSFRPEISVVTIPRANKKRRTGWTAEVGPHRQNDC
jgi:hypothetical protein